MKWVVDKRTGRMVPEEKKGIRVSGRMGGIMVEDFDHNRQFLINYGSDIITHCVGCNGNNLHLYGDLQARTIANEVARVARAHNTTTKYADYRYFSMNARNFNESVETNDMKDSYQLSLLINRLYTASRPFTMHLYSDDSWQNVWAHIESLRKVRGVRNIYAGAEDGGYHNYDGCTSVGDNPAYKEYTLEIETDYGTIIGRLICHSAGTVDDVFSKYDMTCTFWKE